VVATRDLVAGTRLLQAASSGLSRPERTFITASRGEKPTVECTTQFARRRLSRQSLAEAKVLDSMSDSFEPTEAEGGEASSSRREDHHQGAFAEPLTEEEMSKISSHLGDLFLRGDQLSRSFSRGGDAVPLSAWRRASCSAPRISRSRARQPGDVAFSSRIVQTEEAPGGAGLLPIPCMAWGREDRHCGGLAH